MTVLHMGTPWQSYPMSTHGFPISWVPCDSPSHEYLTVVLPHSSPTPWVPHRGSSSWQSYPMRTSECSFVISVLLDEYLRVVLPHGSPTPWVPILLHGSPTPWVPHNGPFSWQSNSMSTSQSSFLMVVLLHEYLIVVLPYGSYVPRVPHSGPSSWQSHLMGTS